MTNIYQLHGELGDIDDQMKQLLEKRAEICRKIHVAEKILTLRARAETVSGIVKSISTINNPTESLHHVNNRLMPWRHSLPRDYFENTLQAIPEGMPSNWTRARAKDFFAALTKAIDDDVSNLETTCKD